MTFDEKYMNIAIKLAEKGIANSFPNPSVGCVIVECDKKSYNNDKIVGYGFTGKGGRPHAEAARQIPVPERPPGREQPAAQEACCRARARGGGHAQGDGGVQAAPRAFLPDARPGAGAESRPNSERLQDSP